MQGLNTIGGSNRWSRWFLQRVAGNQYRLLIERWSVVTRSWESVADKLIEAESFSHARAMAQDRLQRQG
jgi:hypothetical protein